MTYMSLFANAPKVAPKTASSKKEPKEVVIPGFKKLATVNALIEALTTFKTTLKAEVDAEVKSHFVAEGVSLGRKPENFTGVEDVASGSCQLKKRSTRSTLDEASVKLLTDAGLHVEKVEDVVETYRINPAYKDDAKLLLRVSVAIEEINAEAKKKAEKAGKPYEPVVPADFIEHQMGVSRMVVGENALDQVWRLPREQIEMLLPVISVVSEAAKIADAKSLLRAIKEFDIKDVLGIGDDAEPAKDEKKRKKA
jgi:hypothetical protein